ncbi:MAG: hypothetical protein IJF13_00960 [Clostridia bacterium]|nr:hypothetical protein [Clostridia bacterium]
MRKRLSEIKSFKLSGGSNLILSFGLSAIIFNIIYIIGAVFFSEGERRLRSIVLLPFWAEHIFMSLVLVVGGALFYDYIVKRSCQK